MIGSSEQYSGRINLNWNAGYCWHYFNNFNDRALLMPQVSPKSDTKKQVQVITPDAIRNARQNC